VLLKAQNHRLHLGTDWRVFLGSHHPGILEISYLYQSIITVVDIDDNAKCLMPKYIPSDAISNFYRSL